MNNMLKPLGKVTYDISLLQSATSLLPQAILRHLSLNNVTVKILQDGREASVYNNELKEIRLNKKTLIEDFFHEVGHYVFYQLIESQGTYDGFAVVIKEFEKNSILEGGCTLHADKYIKEIYGKKLREHDEAVLNGVDIKFHEQFAEMFKLHYTEHASTRIPKTYEVFLKLMDLLEMRQEKTS